MVNTVKNAAGDPDDFEDAIEDNASDDILCTQTAKSVFKNMFDFGDTTHTMQLIIKHATEGEPEVKLVEQVLLTNKKKTPQSCQRIVARFECCPLCLYGGAGKAGRSCPPSFVLVSSKDVEPS